VRRVPDLRAVEPVLIDAVIRDSVVLESVVRRISGPSPAR